MGSQIKKVVVSTMIGNGLEWYDYALYGMFASIIGRNFFPADSETASTMATFGVFAVGFVMRPLGGMFFGYIGDRYGRRNALAFSILMMSIPTACIGLLPTYDSIGIWAPIALTLIRLVQGLAVGGEFGGSMVYLVECAGGRRRTLLGSMAVVSLAVGLLVGAGVAGLVGALMTPEDYASYGWRIPFVAGLFIGLVGLYIRKELGESPAYEEAKRAGNISERPVRDALAYNMREILLGVGAYMAVTIPFYLQTVYMHGFSVKYMHFTENQAMFTHFGVLVALMVLMPLSGWLADKFGRVRVMAAAALAYMVYAFPFVYLLEQDSVAVAIAAQIFFGAIMAFYLAPIPAFLVDLFPANTRFTGMALSANVAAAAFGGTAPMILTKLMGDGQDFRHIAWYILVAAGISLVCALKSEKISPVPVAAI
ncbi:MAG: MFS transporter [Rickettsiales bacterium]